MSRYILAVIYNEDFKVKKNPELAKELPSENIFAGDACSIFFGRRLDIVTLQDAAAESRSPVKLADGGDVFAQYELSKYNLSAELHYLKMAAEQNYFLALYEVGCKYYFENLYETAREYFARADEMGCGQSTLKLGDIYFDKDKNKAVELYKRAYERGADDRSINRIARSFSNNDNATALNWRRIGEEKNCSTAIKYCKRSIAAGSTSGYSEECLGDIYFEGDNGIERNCEKAATYCEAALAKGTKSKNLAEAEYNTGLKYFEYGRRKVDTAKAVERYKKAYEHGYGDDCIYKIADCYDNIKDYAEALKRFLLGEKNINKSCACNAGDY